jgi:phage RecT family recombinase
MNQQQQQKKTSIVTISNENWRRLKPWQRAGSLRSQLLSRLDQVNAIADAELLPMVPKYLARFVNYCAKAKGVLDCSPLSLVEVFVESMRMRTPIDGKLGYAVPFEIKTHTGEKELRAVFMSSWVGMIAAAKRAGRIISARGFIVHKNDRFEHGQDGAEPICRFVSAAGDPGPMIGSCAVIEISHDPKIWDYEYLTLADVNKIRECSKAKDDGPWKDHPEQMAIKSAFRRLLKRHYDDPSLIELYEHEDGIFGVDANRRRAAISDNSGKAVADPRLIHDMTLDVEPLDDGNQAEPTNDAGADTWTRERILGLFSEATKDGLPAVRKLIDTLTGPDSPITVERLLDYAKEVGGQTIKSLETKGTKK